MPDWSDYYRLVVAAALPLLAAAAFVLTVGVRNWRRRVPGAACVTVAAACLIALPLAVLVWAWCRLTGSNVVPRWWFSTPRTPQVVLGTAAGVVAWQVLLTVGLWRAWRAYDAAEEETLIRSRHAEKRAAP